MDVSFSKVDVESLIARKVKDKAVSAGEKSNLSISNVNIENSEMGIVAKDLSEVQIEKINFKDVAVPISLFVKKTEFGSPSLTISQPVAPSDMSASLISTDSFCTINGRKVPGHYSSRKILSKLYGNEFGVKTIR